MAAKFRSEDELTQIAREILENLRPKHLTVGQLREVGKYLIELTDYIVFRERPIEEQ